MTFDRSVVFSTNKTDCHDITETLLKVVLNQTKPISIKYIFTIVIHFDHLFQSFENEAESFGTYKGMILRSQLIVLLKMKVRSR